ncbi:MAG: hypothetical protein ACJ762_16825 [Solirubrobacteraceae bacterium]
MLLGLGASVPVAQAALLPESLSPLSPISLGSVAGTAVSLGGYSYFFATDVDHGNELWRTDGSPGGTELFVDVNPGTGSGVLSSPSLLVAAGSRLYFAAWDGTVDQNNSVVTSIWSTDGTLGGTGTTSGALPGGETPSSVVVSGDTTYVLSRTPAYDTKLWATHSSLGASVLLRTFPLGTDPWLFAPSGDGSLYFATNASVCGCQVWRSDGTSAGTVALTDFGPANGTDITPLGAGALFQRLDPVDHSRELWTTDGTPAGTSFLGDLEPDEVSVVDGIAYFGADHGLWRSDGTPGGTWKVHDFGPDYPNSPSAPLDAEDEMLFLVGSTVWRSDGTDGGTASVATIPAARYYDAPPMVAVGGDLYISFDAGSAGNRGLWRSDGTPAGTFQLTTWVPRHLSVSHGELLFDGNDGTTGSEPWITDGTLAGTVPLADIDTESDDATVHGKSADIGGKALFAADARYLGTRLFIDDGDQVRTVGDVVPGAQFAVLGGQALFPGRTSETNSELWTTDGTDGGTHLVSEIRPGAQGSDIVKLETFNGTTYFRADDGTTGDELWASDGTTDGTRQVADIEPGAEGSNASILGKTHSQLLLLARRPDQGYELWRSDGSAGGTRLVRSIEPGSGGVDLADLAAGDDHAYFAVRSGAGEGLWRTDGTEGGTVRVRTGLGDYGSIKMAVVGDVGYALLRTYGGDRNVELLRIDPTASEAKRLRLTQDQTGSTGLAATDRAVFFPVGGELWCSDGTAAHTGSLANPGGTITHLTELDGGMYFRAGTGEHRGLWGTDGSASGTRMVSDLAPASPVEFESDGQVLSTAGHDLVFPWKATAHWWARVGPVPSVSGGAGCSAVGVAGDLPPPSGGLILQPSPRPPAGTPTPNRDPPGSTPSADLGAETLKSLRHVTNVVVTARRIRFTQSFIQAGHVTWVLSLRSTVKGKRRVTALARRSATVTTGRHRTSIVLDARARRLRKGAPRGVLLLKTTGPGPLGLGRSSAETTLAAGG